MERSQNILVASVEPEPIGILARWSINKHVPKVVDLCSQFAESGKTSEGPCLQLLPSSRKSHLGALFLCFPYPYKYL